MSGIRTRKQIRHESQLRDYLLLEIRLPWWANSILVIGEALLVWWSDILWLGSELECSGSYYLFGVIKLVFY